jgi:hypothetical protein
MTATTVSAMDAATYRLDEFVGREFFGKGKTSKGAFVGGFVSRDARGRVVTVGLFSTRGGVETRTDFRVNDQVTFGA